jgi:hypothetical protein
MKSNAMERLRTMEPGFPASGRELSLCCEREKEREMGDGIEGGRGGGGGT